MPATIARRPRLAWSVVGTTLEKRRPPSTRALDKKQSKAKQGPEAVPFEAEMAKTDKMPHAANLHDWRKSGKPLSS